MKIIESFPNILSEKIQDKNLTFYQLENDTYIFKVINLESLSEKHSLKFERDFAYQEINSNFFFSCDNKIIKLNTDSNEIVTVIESKKDYITIVNQDHFIVSNYNSEKKVYVNEMNSTKKNVIEEFSKYETFRDLNEEYVISLNPSNRQMGLFNTKIGKYLWEINLQGDLDNKSIFTPNLVLIYQSDYLIALNIYNGNEEFRIHNPINYYTYDSNENKLFGADNQKIEIINLEKGLKETSILLENLITFSPHLTSYYKGYVYFSGLNQNYEPVLGKIEILSGKIMELHDLPGEKSFRGTYSKPLIHNGKVFTKAPNNTLYVFEGADN